MNLRRYSLFLVIALLTFSIGVAAAFVAGAFNPLARSEKRRCGHPSRRLSSLPGPTKPFHVFTVYRSDGTILKATDVDENATNPPTSTFNFRVEPPPPPPAPRPSR